MKLAVPLVLAASLLATPTAASAASTQASAAAEKLRSVKVPRGYELRRFATGLDFPTGIAFGEGKAWVSEAGVTPKEPQPQVVELRRDRTARKVLASGDLRKGTLAPPLIDVTYHRGQLWITHRQKGVNGWLVGAISRFDPDNPVRSFQTVVTNLPSAGDHFTEELVFDRDGRAYFSQGTATNTSVVGPDNDKITKWLEQFPNFHDFPAKDVVLSGEEFQTPNILTDDIPGDTAVTAPFMPFNSGPVDEGTVVKGASSATPQNGIIAGVGTVYSFEPEATNPTATLRLEAWGLRNPFGLALDPFVPRRLFVTNNGADIRTARTPGTGSVEVLPEQDLGDLKPIGARPLANDFDDMGILEVGGSEEFFGWPDYAHNPRTGAVMPVTAPLFCRSPLLQPNCDRNFVLAESFRNSLDVKPMFAQFEVHSSANKFSFSTSGRFGFRGDMFVAETGGFIPQTGALDFAGYKVVRVDRETGRVRDFIVNTGNSVNEVFRAKSFNKPIDVKFRGGKMFIVDFGVFEPGLKLARANTGKVWVVSRCPTLSVSRRSIVAGRRTTIKVTARLGGRRASGVQVIVRGGGVSASAKTGRGGVARLTMTPRTPGMLRATVSGSPRCGAERIGVSSGAEQPSLTG
jgi:hypothetical protein